jgi:hypothetical protein
MLKRAYASSTVMMISHLLHIKTKVNDHVSLNSPFLKTTIVYNMLPRRRQKSLPKLKLPHHS